MKKLINLDDPQAKKVQIENQLKIIKSVDPEEMHPKQRRSTAKVLTKLLSRIEKRLSVVGMPTEISQSPNPAKKRRMTLMVDTS